jgi:class 3 adenylate cyclase
MSQSRKLAAILSADVVGYSRLMGDDERATVETLHACRQLIRERVERHEGRVVDSPGDALLAEFPSAVEATDCAREIQPCRRTMLAPSSGATSAP